MQSVFRDRLKASETEKPFTGQAFLLH